MKKFQLTFHQVYALYEGLQAFGSCRYDAATTLTIVRNRNRLKPLVTDCDEARQALLKARLTGGATSLTAKDNPEAFAAHTAELAELLAKTNDVELEPMTMEQLFANNCNGVTPAMIEGVFVLLPS